jgi:arylsulfatase A-like enzyme
MYDPNAFQLPPDVAGRIPAEKEKELRKTLQVYYGQVTAIDFKIGRLLEGLKKLGVDRDTIILYTSDHGDKLGSHWSPGLRLRGKAAPFASAFRIPLIVRWPARIKPGQVHDCLVSSVDLAPTILDLAGLPIPPAMQGDSMAPWCLTGKGKANEAVYLGLHGSPIGDTKRAWRAVWDGRYIYAPGKFHVLYDHQEDPHEMKNLLRRPEYADVRKRLNALLLRLAERTKDPFLPYLQDILSS